jgi:hypothetical protein
MTGPRVSAPEQYHQISRTGVSGNFTCGFPTHDRHRASWGTMASTKLLKPHFGVVPGTLPHAWAILIGHYMQRCAVDLAASK